MSRTTTRINDRIRAVYTADRGGDTVRDTTDEPDRVALGMAHLAEAQALYEEALRLQRMCRFGGTFTCIGFIIIYAILFQSLNLGCNPATLNT